MYVHPAFEADSAAMTALLGERAFGTLVAHDGCHPVAVYVPFLTSADEAGARIELHVARANPIHEVIARNPAVLLTCLGSDAYVSPDWYGSPNQVPTWNYVAVHATGEARLMPEAELAAHVERLSQHFEERLPKTPWLPGKVEPQRMAALLKGIVGIDVTVTRLEGQRKLGQHKSLADHTGAVGGLRAMGGAAGAAIADLMDAARNIHSRTAP
jgi:transcriptional regulator